MEPQDGDTRVEGLDPARIVDTINNLTHLKRQCLFFRDKEEKLWMRVIYPPTAADSRKPEKQEPE